MMAAASLPQGKFQVALDTSQLRKSTNIEDYRPGGAYREGLIKYGRERGDEDVPSEQHELMEDARTMSAVEGKRMKPSGSRL